jgi:hypothetical protein
MEKRYKAWSSCVQTINMVLTPLRSPLAHDGMELIFHGVNMTLYHMQKDTELISGIILNPVESNNHNSIQ